MTMHPAASPAAIQVSQKTFRVSFSAASPDAWIARVAALIALDSSARTLAT